MMRSIPDPRDRSQRRLQPDSDRAGRHLKPQKKTGPPRGEEAGRQVGAAMEVDTTGVCAVAGAAGQLVTVGPAPQHHERRASKGYRLRRSTTEAWARCKSPPASFPPTAKSRNTGSTRLVG
jgi:hypothetical protein